MLTLRHWLCCKHNTIAQKPNFCGLTEIPKWLELMINV